MGGGGEIPTIVPKFTGSIFMTEYYGRRDLGGIATVEFRFLKSKIRHPALTLRIYPCRLSKTDQWLNSPDEPVTIDSAPGHSTGSDIE